MNPRHELLREAASNLPAFHYDEKQAIRDTIEIEANLVKALDLANTFFELTDGNSKDEKSIAVVHNEIRAALAKAKGAP